jgi:hypothetical protein
VTSKELIKYLVNPDLLSESTVAVLQEMLDEYPYFEVLRMLYLKNLSLIRDLRFSGELKKAALLLSDRTLLFQLIHEKVSPFALSSQSRTEKDRTLVLIDAYFAGKEDGMQNESMQLDDLLSGFSFEATTEVLNEQLSAAEESPALPMKHQDLIDHFLEEVRTSSDVLYPFSDSPEDEEPIAPPVFDESITGSESYFTETLAHIYIKQQRYDRALEIVRELYLNYPEKSLHFAALMDYLEEQIAATDKRN